MYTNANGSPRAADATPTSASQQLKSKVHKRLLETMDLIEARRMPVEQLHAECSRRVDMLLNEQRTLLRFQRPEKQVLLREVMRRHLPDSGPVQEFLRVRLSATSS